MTSCRNSFPDGCVAAGSRSAWPATDGKRWSEWGQRVPDLILLDMNLPVIDGWTVARTLRDRSDTIPIIALTAHAMSGDRRKALDAGCDEHHPKPVDLELLLQQVDEALLRREEADD